MEAWTETRIGKAWFRWTIMKGQCETAREFRLALEEAGETPSSLSRRSGVHVSCISGYLRGRMFPKEKNLLALKDAVFAPARGRGEGEDRITCGNALIASGPSRRK